MFNIQDIREILFDLEMASLGLKQHMLNNLQNSQWMRPHKRLPYPLLMIEI